VGKFALHHKYGRGRVTGRSGYGDDTQVDVIFSDGVTRKFVLKLANLKFIK
jgi:DNA helicase-2/ATP-dependent DNA helicase PcrA